MERFFQILNLQIQLFDRPVLTQYQAVVHFIRAIAVDADHGAVNVNVRIMNEEFQKFRSKRFIAFPDQNSFSLRRLLRLIRMIGGDASKFFPS